MKNRKHWIAPLALGLTMGLGNVALQAQPDGNNPPPNEHDRPDKDEEKERLCRLLQCLLSTNTLGPEFEKHLQSLGLNLDAIRRCLAEWCRRRRPPVVSVPPVITTGQPGSVAGISTSPSSGTGGISAGQPALSAEAINLIRRLAAELERMR